MIKGKVVWGVDLAHSYVEREEYDVLSGVGTPIPSVPVATVIWGDETEYYTHRWDGYNWVERYDPEPFDPTSMILLEVYFEGGVKWELLEYGEAPAWWRKEQETRYQLCSCGRARYDAQNPDGVCECEKCLKEKS